MERTTSNIKTNDENSINNLPLIRRAFIWREEVLDSNLSSTIKLILLVFATYMNDSKIEAFPSIKTLSKRTSLSVPSIIKNIKESIEKGWLKKTKRINKNGSCSSNIYEAILPKEIEQKINKKLFKEVKFGTYPKLDDTLNEVKYPLLNEEEGTLNEVKYPLLNEVNPNNKRENNKENNKRDTPALKKDIPSDNSKTILPPKELFDFTLQFLRKQKEAHPTVIKSITKKLTNDGATTLEKLIRIDGYNFEKEIAPALEWARQDDFWTNNLYSLAPLRKKGKNDLMKFQNIIAQYEKSKHSSKPNNSNRYMPDDAPNYDRVDEIVENGVTVWKREKVNA